MSAMKEFPYRVTIGIPTYIADHVGRQSTSFPDGLITSIRVPRSEVDVIDRARTITDFGMSRGGFIRSAAFKTATEICRHHDAYLRMIKDQQNERHG